MTHATLKSLLAIIVAALFLTSSPTAFADRACYDDCTYECTEYYQPPHQHDCRKTKKTCTKICSNNPPPNSQLLCHDECAEKNSSGKCIRIERICQ